MRRRPHIVIGTPGRILDHLNQKTLSLAACKVLTIDEIVSKTIRDIDPQAFAQLRSAIALAEKWRSEQTPEPSLTTSHARD